MSTLEPTKQNQEKLSSIEELKSLIDNSSTPEFNKQVSNLIDLYLPGDEIIEYCTSIKSWQIGQGSSGYILKRNNEVISSLICKMS